MIDCLTWYRHVALRGCKNIVKNDSEQRSAREATSVLGAVFHDVLRMSDVCGSDADPVNFIFKTSSSSCSFIETNDSESQRVYPADYWITWPRVVRIGWWCMIYVCFIWEFLAYPNSGYFCITSLVSDQYGAIWSYMELYKGIWILAWIKNK